MGRTRYWRDPSDTADRLGVDEGDVMPGGIFQGGLEADSLDVS
jgi:hypothetical protein